MFSSKTVHLRITGGTDVAWSIPIDYFISVLLKQLKPYANIKIIVQSRGYYPKGGGCIEFYCEGKYKLDNINTAQKIMLANTTQKYSPIIGISHASSSLKHAKVAERQAESAKSILERASLSANISAEYNHTLSDGSGIVLWTSPEDENSSTILGSDCLGERKRRAEDIGSSAAHDMISMINKNIPCDEHLADQLIPLLGLVGGKIRTDKITGHIRSNIYVTEKFLEVKFVVDENDNIIKI
jgi:RNA 3'-terminal phosphate cyclase (ATP)